MTVWDWVLAIAAGVLFLLFVINLRYRLFTRLVGPMFWYDLIRLARRGQQPRLRVALVAILLVGLFITYLRVFPDDSASILFDSTTSMPIDKSSQFGETFLIAFLFSQLAAVVLITPAMLGSAITEEKERKTFDFLRSSLLANHEIVLGKFMARMLFVIGVILAGLPVLSMTMLFGGVDGGTLLAGYGVTLLTVTGIGSISLYLGVMRDSLRDVLVWAYGLVGLLSVIGSCCSCVPGFGGLSPFTVMATLIAPRGPGFQFLIYANLGTFFVLYGPVAGLFVWKAIGKVRPPIPRKRKGPDLPVLAKSIGPQPLPGLKRERRPVEIRDDDEDDEFETPNDRRPHRSARSFSVPKLASNNPFLWKERYFSTKIGIAEGQFLSSCGISVVSGALFILGSIVFINAAIELERSGGWSGRAITLPVTIFLVAIGPLLSILIGTQCVTAVARERERQTLESLLMIPIRRREILIAKVLAGFVWLRWVLLVFVVATAGAMLVGGLHPVSWFTVIMQIGSFTLLTSAVGIWLSVRCHTVTRATVFLLVILFSLWLAPVALTPVIAALLGLTFQDSNFFSESVLQFCLPYAIATNCFSWSDFVPGNSLPHGWFTYGIPLLPAAFYLFLAIFFWFASINQFENEGRN